MDVPDGLVTTGSPPSHDGRARPGAGGAPSDGVGARQDDGGAPFGDASGRRGDDGAPSGDASARIHDAWARAGGEWALASGAPGTGAWWRGPRRGRVVAYDEASGLGTLDAADGHQLPFHCTAIADGSRAVTAGTVVWFVVGAGQRGRWEAVAVTPLVRPEAD